MHTGVAFLQVMISFTVAGQPSTLRYDVYENFCASHSQQKLVSQQIGRTDCPLHINDAVVMETSPFAQPRPELTSMFVMYCEQYQDDFSEIGVRCK